MVPGLVGVNSKCGVQSKRKHESHDSYVCIAGFSACGCQKKSVVYKKEYTEYSPLIRTQGMIQHVTQIGTLAWFKQNLFQM